MTSSVIWCYLFGWSVLRGCVVGWGGVSLFLVVAGLFLVMPESEMAGSGKTSNGFVGHFCWDDQGWVCPDARRRWLCHSCCWRRCPQACPFCHQQYLSPDRADIPQWLQSRARAAPNMGPIWVHPTPSQHKIWFAEVEQYDLFICLHCGTILRPVSSVCIPQNMITG